MVVGAVIPGADEVKLLCSLHEVVISYVTVLIRYLLDKRRALCIEKTKLVYIYFDKKKFN